MTDPAFIVSSLLLLLFGIYIGFIFGDRIGGDAKTAGAYWRANIACIAAATVAFALLGAVPLLYSAVAGLMAGSLVGLKMGFGAAVGPWRKVDEMFDVGAARRARRRGAGARSRRRADDAGRGQRELISVPGDEATDADGATDRRCGAHRPARSAGGTGQQGHKRR